MRFYVQVGFSSIVLCFCLFKLANADDSQSSALYWSGVTSILAWWMPSPEANNPSRNIEQANAVNSVQIEKVESLPQMNGFKN
jgi:hypothetical protein